VWANIVRRIPSVLVQTDTCFPPELSKPPTQYSIHGINNNILKSQSNFGLSNVCFILMASLRKTFKSISLFLGVVFSRLMQNSLQILHLLMSAILLGCKKLQIVFNTKALTRHHNVTLSYANHTKLTEPHTTVRYPVTAPHGRG